MGEKIHDIYLKDQAGTLTEADIPTCDKCGAPLDLNLAGENFEINQKQVHNFEKFITNYQDKKLLVI